jgi:hypothetical protein
MFWGSQIRLAGMIRHQLFAAEMAVYVGVARLAAAYQDRIEINKERAKDNVRHEATAEREMTGGQALCLGCFATSSPDSKTSATSERDVFVRRLPVQINGVTRPLAAMHIVCWFFHILCLLISAIVMIVSSVSTRDLLLLSCCTPCAFQNKSTVLFPLVNG